MGLVSLVMYNLESAAGLLQPLIFLGTILLLFTNIIFFGAFTIAWVDFYKMMSKGKK
jgi:hypothetical protein